MFNATPLPIETGGVHTAHLSRLHTCMHAAVCLSLTPTPLRFSSAVSLPRSLNRDHQAAVHWSDATVALDKAGHYAEALSRDSPDTASWADTLGRTQTPFVVRASTCVAGHCNLCVICVIMSAQHVNGTFFYTPVRCHTLSI